MIKKQTDIELLDRKQSVILLEYLRMDGLKATGKGQSIVFHF